MSTKRSLATLGTVLLLASLAALEPLRAAAEDESPHARAIKQAQEAMAESEFQVARDVLKKELETAPNEPYLMYNVGVTFYAEGNLETASEWFQRADLESKDENLRALILAQLGNIESHRGRDALGSNKEQALDHFRRAHQVYTAALTRDSGQKIALANHEPARDGIVVLIVGKAKKQIAMAKDARSPSNRISQLTTTRSELEEALQLAPGHTEAKKLKGEVDAILVENLTNLGDERVQKAEDVLAKGGKLADALNAITAAENNYRDALMIEPESKALENKLAAATKLSSKILTELGKKNIERSAEEKLAPRQIERLQDAISNFDQAMMADPDNKEAQELKQETEQMLAERFENAGDNAVETAEKRPDTPEHVARNRQQADSAYTNAAALNPDDAELQEKRRENALELASALEKTGNKELEEGASLVAQDPAKAVAKLEQALNDFTTGSQLLQEHGESDVGMQEGMEKAGSMMEGQSEQGGEQPGEQAGGTEPGEQGEGAAEGEGSEPGEGAGEGSEPGEGAGEGAEPGEGSEPGEGGQPGEGQPGSQPGEGQPGQGQPGQGQPGPGGPSQAAMEQGAQQAMELLQQARMELAEMAAAESMADKGGSGTPTYESVAYVTGGSDFNDEEGGGGSEVEGNFNTEAMNHPVRDW